MNDLNIGWLLKMAWRDSRRNRSRLFLFISSIILGIASLVAINSFSENLQKDINTESKSLLGADLRIEGTAPAKDNIIEAFDSISTATAKTTEFVSMIQFPRTGDTKMAYIKGLEGAYPFYGTMLTDPIDAAENFRNKKSVVVDKTLMVGYGMQPGDSIKIGETTFLIEGNLISAPGSVGLTSSIAPTIFVPAQYLQNTGLLQTGSRVEHFYFFKTKETADVDASAKAMEETLQADNMRYETVARRKRNLGRAFGSVADFLNLVGFVALLLGCVGVASAISIYVKDKIPSVAILRTLGSKGSHAFIIFLIQIFVMGIIGSIIGAIIGSLLQVFLPLVLQDFLPIQNVSNDISWSAVTKGILTGISIAVLFALLPLLAIRNISPLRTLRAGFDDGVQERDPIRWLVYALIGFFIFLFTYAQTGNWLNAAIFIGAVGIAFLILSGFALLVMYLVKKFFPTNWSFTARQSIANLYRPNNQTLILIVTIGLGTALISTLFLTKDMLLSQVEMSGSGSQPNLILFDIQTSQKDGVAELTRAHDLPIIQQVPVVTMRVEEIDGITRKQRLADTTSQVRKWVYNREYRSTYRDTLIETEKILDGQWFGNNTYNEDGLVNISISTRVQEAMKAKVGTKINFNVQGAIVETIVSSIRDVDFSRVQTNFFVVFPKGVLEEAPQFHVIVSRTETPQESAGFQRALVSKFPNVSAVDLGQILKSVDDILTKVSFVIQFMSLFSILTGIFVLISSVLLNKFQRIKESILLRTLGAQKKQIININAIEYFILGTLASMTGIILSFAGSFLLAKFVFKIDFVPSLMPPFIIFLSITLMTVLIGMFGSRGVLSRPPLEVLRREG